jgi:hypothetical protein
MGRRCEGARVRKFEKEENGKGRNENLSACEAPDSV